MAMDRDGSRQLRLFLGLAVRSTGGDQAGKCHWRISAAFDLVDLLSVC